MCLKPNLWFTHVSLNACDYVFGTGNPCCNKMYIWLIYYTHYYLRSASLAETNGSKIAYNSKSMLQQQKRRVSKRMIACVRVWVTTGQIEEGGMSPFTLLRGTRQQTNLPNDLFSSYPRRQMVVACWLICRKRKEIHDSHAQRHTRNIFGRM